MRLPAWFALALAFALPAACAHDPPPPPRAPGPVDVPLASASPAASASVSPSASASPSASPGLIQKPTGSIRQGATQVVGKLPPAVIQRVVRLNMGRFRTCYEDNLRTSPNLQGRVAIKFVIGTTGAVTSANDAGSDLPDTGIIKCVQETFATLVFPQPEGGPVTVVYPLVFSPGD